MWYAERLCPRRIELSGSLMFLEPVPNAGHAVSERSPTNGELLIVEAHILGPWRPLSHLDREGDVTGQVIDHVMDKAVYALWSENDDRPRIVALCTEHEHAREPEAVVGVKVGDRDQPEGLDPETKLFEGDLDALTTVKLDHIGARPDDNGGEPSSRQWHHPPRPEHETLHFTRP